VALKLWRAEEVTRQMSDVRKERGAKSKRSTLNFQRSMVEDRKNNAER
jgi:hypothetical protein